MNTPMESNASSLTKVSPQDQQRWYITVEIINLIVATEWQVECQYYVHYWTEETTSSAAATWPSKNLFIITEYLKGLQIAM